MDGERKGGFADASFQRDGLPRMWKDRFWPPKRARQRKQAPLLWARSHRLLLLRLDLWRQPGREPRIEEGPKRIERRRDARRLPSKDREGAKLLLVLYEENPLGIPCLSRVSGASIPKRTSFDICPVCGWQDDGMEANPEKESAIGLTHPDAVKEFKEKRTKNPYYRWAVEVRQKRK